jgi:hypothetical protein
MNTRQDQYTDMQKKLREGLKILSEASQEDTRSLNDALLKIHGALEDFVRLELAAKAPQLQGEVESKRTTWKTLIEYGKEYLGFTEYDARTITDANNQRQKVAHGGNYSGSLSELVDYAEFVKRRVSFGKPSTIDRLPQRVAEPPKPPPPPPYSPSSPIRPWYRSTPFLFLTFFLLPPIWAILILTDQRQGGLARLAAGSVLLSAFFCVLGFLYAWGFFSETSAAIAPAALTLPSASSPEPPSARDTDLPGEPAFTAGTVAACTILWVEYSDDLGAKSRAMVWEEIVVHQVQGSGMDHREFYDLVVEHNPHLETDGFEFKKGKTYLLPKCQ